MPKYISTCESCGLPCRYGSARCRSCYAAEPKKTKADGHGYIHNWREHLRSFTPNQLRLYNEIMLGRSYTSREANTVRAEAVEAVMLATNNHNCPVCGDRAMRVKR